MAERFYKIVEDGYILAIGTGGGGVEITEEEYNEIMAVIQNKAPWEGNTDYRLKEDYTWEEYERPPVDTTDEDIPTEEALSILTGGEI